MHASNKLFSLFAAASALAPGAWSAPSARLAIPQSANPARRDILDGPITGKGTFYGGAWAGGTCSFSTYTQPAGLFGTALAGPNWDTSGNCGGCVSVTGPNGKTITAMIVDECPGCEENHLDLFQDAFDQLAAESVGVIDLNWQYVECPSNLVTGPLSIHMKSGASQYWFSAQVIGATRRTSTLEVSSDGGATWQPTERQAGDNFFQLASGTGSNKVDIRVTSHINTQVVIKDVPVVGDQATAATENYA